MSRFFSSIAAVLLVPTLTLGQSDPIAPVRNLGSQPDWVADVAFSPSGQLVVAGGYDFVSGWNTESWKAQRLLTDCGEVGSVAFNPSGKLLAIGGYQRIVLCEISSDGSSLDQKAELKGHRGLVTDLAFLSDQSLISASLDGTVRTWNTASGDVLRTIDAGEPVQALAVRENLLVTASGDPDRPTRPGHVRLWNLENGTLVREIAEHSGAATTVGFLDNGTVLSGGYDERVRLSGSTVEAVREFSGHARPVRGLVTLADGLVVSVSGGNAGGRNELIVWDPARLEPVKKFEPHQQPITAVARSSDGRLIATGSLDKRVAVFAVPQNPPAVIRIGMIGLDTSHCGAFTKVLNDPDAAPDVAGCKVVCAYPFGSRDIESSASRIPRYTEDMKKLGVEITDSIDELLTQVDAVLLETNDGRLHLEQFLACAKAGKPVFIDKPVAAHLDDVLAIYEVKRRYKVPMFSSSSLRYATGAQEARQGALGKVLGCDAYSPCSFEKTHSDFYWYGIHGVELLYTTMGTGCRTVTRTSTPTAELVVGQWGDGRVGTFRGVRSGKTGYGGTAYGEKGIKPLGGYAGYRPLVAEIVSFFKSGKSPVSDAETIELYAFMAAAEESHRLGGTAVEIETVMEKARVAAEQKLEALGVKQD